jgi:hypothetical protein
MTDISVLSAVERVARVIAAEALSPNGEGPDWSERGPVSERIDSVWRQEVPRALAVLRTLREPTPEMVEAGRNAGSDPAEIWNAMVRIAIDQDLEALA